MSHWQDAQISGVMMASKQSLSTNKWLNVFFAACGASEGKWEALVSAGDVSTFIVQCYIYFRISVQHLKTQFHTNSGTGAMWTATSQWQEAGGLLRWLLATHGILRFGVPSMLLPSSCNVGNVLSLATPDLQQRIWDNELFLVKKPIYQVSTH